MKSFLKFMILFGVIFAVTSYVLMSQQLPEREPSVPYSTFIKMVKNDQIFNVIMERNGELKVTSKAGEDFKVYAPDDGQLVNDLLQHNVTVRQNPPPKRPHILLELLISWLPALLLAGVMIYIFVKQSGRNGMGFGKSKAKLIAEDKVNVSFADVAGVDEAKEEVSEIVEFLKDPKKFDKLGGRIPKGCLLVGPPGTGKTLLSRSIASEAKVPFFQISGSDFVEMFVGVGASRVRDMFEEAKKKAPCIIFIDEIDAVGKQRASGPMAHDEREQTLNQLLVEMDGFDNNTGVIVIAATNRVDVLDQALLRPGRFDRQIFVNLPDINGREDILKVHTKNIPLENNVDLKAIARGTPRFSGADLANIVNEAAIIASKNNRKAISMKDFEHAKDKILMGAEKKALIMTDDEKWVTSLHEAGHLVVGWYSPEHDPVYKVSIIPRGRALGITMFLPERDHYSMSRRKLESQIASLYGGRIAEELEGGLDGVTTGASNDIERASQIAENMVKRWGMSKKVGARLYVPNEDSHSPFGQSNHPNTDIDFHKVVEDEIREILEINYTRAEQIILTHKDKLYKIGRALMEHETIDLEQITEIMNGDENDNVNN